ncbi:hypothetical protein IV102_14680 [bacterium]|nr:hypothetical protein [bacterium]
MIPAFTCRINARRSLSGDNWPAVACWTRSPRGGRSCRRREMAEVDDDEELSLEQDASAWLSY